MNSPVSDQLEDKTIASEQAKGGDTLETTSELEQMLATTENSIKKLDEQLAEIEKERANLKAERDSLLEKINARKTAEPENQLENTGAPKNETKQSCLSGYKILIVDDSQFVLAALSESFKKEGLQVVKASSAAEAIKKLGQHSNIALIISDIAMPGCDGLQFVNALRTLPRTSALPIILYSGTPTYAYEDAARRLKVADFVNKRTEDILRAIKEVLCPVEDESIAD